LEYITRILSRNAGIRTILDVGCGSGKIAIPLWKSGYTMVGIDNDELPLKLLKRNNGTVVVVKGDALDLPFGDDSFDCILAIHVIDSIENREKSYGEVLRVLKPGGLFIIQMSNKRSMKGLVYELYLKMKKRQRMAGDLENYRRDYKEQAMELGHSGFRIVDAKGYNWNLIPRNSDSKLLPLWEALEAMLGLENLPMLSPLVLATVRSMKRHEIK
jgi:ubiquinone/menaquinone biosynthesis C-methylase UbiE